MEAQLTKPIEEDKIISDKNKPLEKVMIQKVESDDKNSSSSKEITKIKKPVSNKTLRGASEDKLLMSEDSKKENIKQNPMRDIEIEKIVLNCGGIGDKLEKSVKLLEMITKRKVQKLKSTRRIPAFAISPGKESGCKVTIRDKEQIKNLLKRFFAVLENEISGKKITENHFAFGISEYIEVPGLEYNRDVGILGFEVDVVFKRKGKRVKFKKIKRGKYPKKQNVTKQEIIDFLNKNFGMEII